MGIDTAETRVISGNRLGLGTIRRREFTVSDTAHILLLKILADYRQKIMGTLFHGRRPEKTTNRATSISCALKDEKIRVHDAQSLKGLDILHDITVVLNVQMPLLSLFPSL